MSVAHDAVSSSSTSDTNPSALADSAAFSNFAPLPSVGFIDPSILAVSSVEPSFLAATSQSFPGDGSSVGFPSIDWAGFIEQDSSASFGAAFPFDDLYPSGFTFEAPDSSVDSSLTSDCSGFLGSGPFLES